MLEFDPTESAGFLVIKSSELRGFQICAGAIRAFYKPLDRYRQSGRQAKSHMDGAL